MLPSLIVYTCVLLTLCWYSVLPFLLPLLVCCHSARHSALCSVTWSALVFGDPAVAVFLLKNTGLCYYLSCLLYALLPAVGPRALSGHSPVGHIHMSGNKILICSAYWHVHFKYIQSKTHIKGTLWRLFILQTVRSIKQDSHECVPGSTVSLLVTLGCLADVIYCQIMGVVRSFLELLVVYR